MAPAQVSSPTSPESQMDEAEQATEQSSLGELEIGGGSRMMRFCLKTRASKDGEREGERCQLCIRLTLTVVLKQTPRLLTRTSLQVSSEHP